MTIGGLHVFYYDTSILILIPAMIFALWAQATVQRSFKRYSRVRNQKESDRGGGGSKSAG